MSMDGNAWAPYHVWYGGRRSGRASGLLSTIDQERQREVKYYDVGYVKWVTTVTYEYRFVFDIRS